MSYDLTAPRQLTRKELRDRYQLQYAFDPATRAIAVPREWQHSHLVQLELIPGKPKVWLHVKAAPVFVEWFARIKANGLTSRIQTIDGGFVPRVNRGAKLPAQLDAATVEQFLSRHAHGAALDTNALTNQRGTEGAQLGQPGCVRELVQLAYGLDIVWGGAWRGSMCDPMHWEIGTR